MPVAQWIDLGSKDYLETWDYQKELFNANIQAKLDGSPTTNYLLFVEHPPVYTIGKSGDRSHLLANPEFLKMIGATYYEIERGGDITYHGPGQVVVYPIFDLEEMNMGVRKFIESMEKAIIRTVSEYGILGAPINGYTGVWLDEGEPNERKIAAIGVKCSRQITMHGLALNVNTDLSYFNHIVPCGIPEKQVTSIEKEVGRKILMEEVKERLKNQFSSIFELEIT